MTRKGKSNNVGNPWYGRETVTRDMDTAYRNQVSNDYGKEPAKERTDEEGIRVYPKHY
jgi:hypothetical protein